MTGYVLLVELGTQGYAGHEWVAVPFPTAADARDWEDAHQDELADHVVRGVARLTTRGEFGDASDR